MPLTSFPNSNHQTAVNTHAPTVLRGLQGRDQDNPVTARVEQILEVAPPVDAVCVGPRQVETRLAVQRKSPRLT